MTLKICPFCGELALEHKIKPVTYTFKTHPFTINQPADWCDSCGEGIIHPEDNKAVLADIQEQKAKIDGLLPPDEIRKIREMLGLDQ